MPDIELSEYSEADDFHQRIYLDRFLNILPCWDVPTWREAPGQIFYGSFIENADLVHGR